MAGKKSARKTSNKRKPAAKGNGFNALLDKRARARRNHLLRRYRGRGVKLPPLADFRRAILVDIVQAKRAKALKTAPPEKRAAVRAKFGKRDELAGYLKAGRKRDSEGWMGVWDSPLSKVTRYYGLNLTNAVPSAAKASGRKRVLMIGAGTGRAAAELAGKVKKQGIKVDGTSLRRLDSHASYQEKHPNLKFRVCHFGRLTETLGKGKYAVVFSYGSTDRISNPNPVVAEVRNLLAKGGTAMIDTQKMIAVTELRKWSEVMPLSTERAGCFRYILKK